ncbi:MAG: hypothetical protein V3S40_03520 [Kiloniellales bacterium]
MRPGARWFSSRRGTIIRTMSNKADLDELAQRYLDLWQDQMSALAADKDFAEALQQLMTGMGLAATSAPAAWGTWPAMMAGLDPAASMGQTAYGQTRDSASNPKTRPAAGSAPAADASDGGLAGLDEFARRIASLEERIAALEAGGKRRGGGTSSKPRKGRS